LSEQLRDPSKPTEDPMTDERMALVELLQKSGDGDFLRAVASQRPRRCRLKAGARSSGLGLGPSEAEPFWSTFLKGLIKRGLKGVKLVISDAHDGLRHAITRGLGATWQKVPSSLDDRRERSSRRERPQLR
jgi:Transposase, Mutator family